MLVLLVLAVLELASLFGICRVNMVNATLRRRNRLGAMLYTISLWFCFQLLSSYSVGFVFQTMKIAPGYAPQFYGFLGSLCGLLISWMIARRGRPIPAGTGDLTPEELAWVRDVYPLAAPCAVTVTRVRGPGGGGKITLLNNGQPLGVLGYNESFAFTVNTTHNIVTANDMSGLRLFSCAPFDAPSGGQVEVLIQGPVFQRIEVRGGL